MRGEGWKHQKLFRRCSLVCLLPSNCPLLYVTYCCVTSVLLKVATTYEEHIYLNHKVKFTCAGRESWLWYKFSKLKNSCKNRARSWSVTSGVNVYVNSSHRSSLFSHVSLAFLNFCSNRAFVMFRCVAKNMMPYRILCNDKKRKCSKARSELALTLSRFTPLHKIRYGIPLHAIYHGQLLFINPGYTTSLRISWGWRMRLE